MTRHPFDAPPTLRDASVELRPLVLEDAASLARYATSDDTWEHFTSLLDTPERMRAWVEAQVAASHGRTQLSFAIVDRASGETIGSTSFGNLSLRDARVEIGWSWIGTPWRGTHVNRTAKRLLLEHAFDHWQMQRVEFKTDALNLRARRALERIGARPEGILRSHTLMPGGRRRDSIYYSVLLSEWPAVRERLLRPLSGPG